MDEYILSVMSIPSPDPSEIPEPPDPDMPPPTPPTEPERKPIIDPPPTTRKEPPLIVLPIWMDALFAGRRRC
jgi:hypothetical protein